MRFLYFKKLEFHPSHPSAFTKEANESLRQKTAIF